MEELGGEANSSSVKDDNQRGHVRAGSGRLTGLSVRMLSAGVGPAKHLASPGVVKPAQRSLPPSPAPGAGGGGSCSTAQFTAVALAPETLTNMDRDVTNPFEDDMTWQTYATQLPSINNLTAVTATADTAHNEPLEARPAEPAQAANSAGLTVDAELSRTSAMPFTGASQVLAPVPVSASALAPAAPTPQPSLPPLRLGPLTGHSIRVTVTTPPDGQAGAAAPTGPKSHKLQAILSRARAAVAARAPASASAAASYSCMGTNGAVEPEAEEQPQTARTDGTASEVEREVASVGAGSVTGSAPPSQSATPLPADVASAEAGAPSVPVAAVSDTTAASTAPAVVVKPAPVSPLEAARPRLAASLAQFAATASRTGLHVLELAGVRREPLVPYDFIEKDVAAADESARISRVRTHYRSCDVRELQGLMMVQRMRNVQTAAAQARQGRGRKGGGGPGLSRSVGAATMRHGTAAGSRRGSLLHGRSASSGARPPLGPPLAPHASASVTRRPSHSRGASADATLERPWPPAPAGLPPRSATPPPPAPASSSAPLGMSLHAAPGEIDRMSSARSTQSRQSASNVAVNASTAPRMPAAPRAGSVAASLPAATATEPAPSLPLLPPSPEPVHVMRWSPNGKYLAVAGGTDTGATLRVWRVWSWERHAGDAAHANEAHPAMTTAGDAALPASSVAASARSTASADESAAFGGPSMASSVTVSEPASASSSGRATADLADDLEPVRKSSAASAGSNISASTAVSASVSAQQQLHAKRLSVEYLQKQSDTILSSVPPVSATAVATPSTAPGKPGRLPGPFPLFEPRPVREWTGHTSHIVDVTWSPSSSLLLTASMDCSVRLWSLNRSSCVHRFVHSDVVTAVAFHPLYDAHFVTGCFDRRLRVWATDSRRMVNWQSTAAVVTSVAYTPDGKLVAAGLFNGTVTLHASDSLRYFTTVEVRPSSGRNSKGRKVTSIEFTRVPSPIPALSALSGRVFPNVPLMLVSTNDGRLRLIRLDDFSCAAKFVGHASSCMQIRAGFDASGSRVISGSEDGRVVVWRTLGDHHNPAWNPRFTGASRHRITSCEFFTADDGTRPQSRGRKAPSPSSFAQQLCSALRLCFAKGGAGEAPSAVVPTAVARDGLESDAPASGGGAGSVDGDTPTDSGRQTPLDDASDAMSVRSYESGWSDTCDSVLSAGSALGTGSLATSSVRGGPDGGDAELPQPGSNAPSPALGASPMAPGSSSAAVHMPTLRLSSLRSAPLGPTTVPASSSTAEAGGVGGNGELPGFSAVEIPEAEGDCDEGDEDEDEEDEGTGVGARLGDAAQPSAAHHSAREGSAAVSSEGANGNQVAFLPHATGAGKEVDITAVRVAPHAASPALRPSEPVPAARPSPSLTAGTTCGEAPVAAAHTAATSPQPLTAAALASAAPAPTAAALAPSQEPADSDGEAREDIRGGFSRARPAVPVAIFAPPAALAIARPLHAASVWARWPLGPLQAADLAAGACDALSQAAHAARATANHTVIVAADSAGMIRVYETTFPATVI